MNARTHTASLLRALLILCLVSLGAMEARGQGITEDGESADRSGTAGAAHLLVPLTARYTALGSTTTSGLANMNGIEALYSNPAGLAANTGTSALFSRMEYVADIGVNYFGVGQAFGNNSVALTVTSWDFGDIPKQTEGSPEVSSVTYDATFITAGLTYARQLTDRISAGTTVKVVNESIDDVSATAVAFDAGMTYVVGESGLRLGVSLNNIGNELKYDGTGLDRTVKLPEQQGNASNNTLQIDSEGVELPTLLNFGVSYAREMGAGAVVTALGNFRSNSFDQNQYSGGLELGFQDLVFVRGGFQLVEDMDATFYQGATFGAGLNLSFGGTRLTVDYAVAPTDFFDNIQYITASVTL